ncbi:MAG: Ig-like domain-containing protein [Lachnospiraceae bacterium]|nr:Ig-like domain-containing protein [Lachnospiraceae bacterium]
MTKIIFTLMIFILAIATKTINVKAASNVNTQVQKLREIYTELYPAVEVTGEKSYFTVNGSYCTHEDHTTASANCSNCYLGNILSELNSKNSIKFSTAYNLYTNNPVGSRTCVAFQRFVWLYVFENREWLSSEYSIVLNKQNANYTNFSKLRPGDTVDYYRKSNDEFYHSAIFLNCDTTAVTLLDCNWTGSGTYKHTIVRVRTIKYEDLTSYSIKAKRANNSKISGLENINDYVSLDPTYITIPIGESFDFTCGQAMETTANKKDLSWESSNTGIATVSEGKVVGKAAGEVTIAVKTSSGDMDTVKINVVNISYNEAENWTNTTGDIGPRVLYSSSAVRANQWSGGYYIAKRDSSIDIISKQKDARGNTWGFGAVYSEFLGQNIWGWFDLLDATYGNETLNYSYYPEIPAISITKASEGVATISWQSVERATSYNLYKNNVLIRTGISTTTVTTDIVAGSNVTFMVEAVNEDFIYSNLFVCKTSSVTVNFTMPECTHPAANREIRNSVASTCKTRGYTGDTYCTVCEKKIASGTTVSVISHSYSEIWSKNASSHWHTCTECGTETDNDPHIYNNDCDTTCNICGYARNITHNYRKVWSMDGSNHWHECIVCGIKKDIAKHTAGTEATETTAQNCTVCDYVIKGMIGHIHNYSNVWSTDELQHWNECSCKAKENIENHTYDNDCDVNCNICGYKRNMKHTYSDIWKTDATNHWHECTLCGSKENISIHIVGEVASETTAQKCTICEYIIASIIGHIHQYNTTYESNNMMHWHSCSCGEKVDVENHKWDMGVVTVEPTENTKGEKVYTCIACTYTKLEDIDILYSDKDNTKDTEEQNVNKGENGTMELSTTINNIMKKSENKKHDFNIEIVVRVLAIGCAFVLLFIIIFIFFRKETKDRKER